MKWAFDNMKKDICPFCGKEEYETWEGETIWDGEFDIQISPDEYHCSYCGFGDSERCKYTEQELIKKHKKQIQKSIKSNLKWCNYMQKVLERLEK